MLHIVILGLELTYFQFQGLPGFCRICSKLILGLPLSDSQCHGLSGKWFTSRKSSKHADSCSRAGFDFIPFAFDTAGHLATDGVAVLRRLQMAWASSQVVRDDVAN